MDQINTKVRNLSSSNPNIPENPLKKIQELERAIDSINELYDLFQERMKNPHLDQLERDIDKLFDDTERFCLERENEKEKIIDQISLKISGGHKFFDIKTAKFPPGKSVFKKIM